MRTGCGFITDLQLTFRAFYEHDCTSADFANSFMEREEAARIVVERLLAELNQATQATRSLSFIFLVFLLFPFVSP